MCSHPQGATSYHEAGLPNITGFLDTYENQFENRDNGALWVDGWAGNSWFHSDARGGTVSNFHLDASRCSAVYGRSDTVQPSSVTMNFFIRAR